jgi:hypothetical protein
LKGEGQTAEKKSLKSITGGKADFDAIAGECVGFANARGGHLHFGESVGGAVARLYAGNQLDQVENVSPVERQVQVEYR